MAHVSFPRPKARPLSFAEPQLRLCRCSNDLRLEGLAGMTWERTSVSDFRFVPLRSATLGCGSQIPELQAAVHG